MTERFSGLEVHSELGRGSMGQVLLAHQLPSGRLVAVKRLGESDSLSAVQQARLRREADALARLDHAHVVRLLELIQVGEELLLVLEFVDGPSLAQLLAADVLAPHDALAVVEQTCHALEHAHRLGVAHRDVKPSNVLISGEGICKLTDFGLARLDDIAAGASRTILTRPGTPLGTAPYMAPEAVMGRADLDAQADLYSLAVMAYQLLVGRLPFPSDMGMLAILDAHLSKPVPRPTHLVPGFSPGVEAVLLSALEKDRDRRTQGVARFREDLAQAAEGTWAAWRRHTDLCALVPRAVSAPPQASRVEPTPPSSWAFPELGRVEPQVPQLHRGGPSKAQVLWVLVALVALLGSLLVVRVTVG